MGLRDKLFGGETGPQGVPGRGVISKVGRGQVETTFDQYIWVWVKPLGWPDNAATKLKFNHGGTVHEGAEIPVWLDPATGAVVGIDGPRMQREGVAKTVMKHRGEPKGIDKLGQRFMSKIMSPELLNPQMNDFGVSMETWCRVRAGLAIYGDAAGDPDVYAQSCGVPAGVWAQADVAWMTRSHKDAAVSAQARAMLDTFLRG